MHLKSIELIGFKSFLKRTKLEFEPGITAVVGPNGCGKSNVLDAVRWILGEQSAKSLRGSKMEDCIFNGTENRRPLGMAEASMTFARCEEALGTDYDEVTITRRVFRSGEGQYFINKTPCRLKDIQRLFMDTGVGTTSYSIMEQGRIDQILSSRPEDRRAIFEEASGITKFKADRKEAIRKVEQTEANLLRLADVIREVKRQIGSLQRQAGKARRYKSGREELRGLDIYLTRRRLAEDAEQTRTLETQLSSAAEQLESANADIAELAKKNDNLRRHLAETEHEIGTLMESRAGASARHERAKDTIRMNRERIEESEGLAQLDTDEISRAASRVDAHRSAIAGLQADLQRARKEEAEAESAHRQKTDALAAHEDATDVSRAGMKELQSSYVELESSAAGLQNELLELDAGKRADLLRRERLAAERIGLEKEAADYAEREALMSAELKSLDVEMSRHAALVEEAAARCSSARKAISEEKNVRAGLQTQIAARKAQVALLGAGDADSAFTGGAKLLLDESNPLAVSRNDIIGPLAESLDAEPEFRVALESSLRSWLDAVVVSNAPAAITMLEQLQSSGSGCVRLLSADIPVHDAVMSSAKGTPLFKHIKCGKRVKQVAQRLLGNVFVVDRLEPAPPSLVYVTRDGALARGSESFEFWTPDGEEAGPLSRKRVLAEAGEELPLLEGRLAESEKRLESLDSDLEGAGRALEAARAELDERRHAHGIKEGELQLVIRESAQAKDRLETVTWEVESLAGEGESAEDRKKALAAQLAEVVGRRDETRSRAEDASRNLRNMEDTRSTLVSDLMDARLRYSEIRQKADLLEGQVSPMQERLSELKAIITNRSDGLASRRETVKRLRRGITDAESMIATLEKEVEDAADKLDRARAGREQGEKELALSDSQLAEKRSLLDELREGKSLLEIRLAEHRMRRENIVDRVTSEYRITLDRIMSEPEPDWNDGKPDNEWIDTRVAELRAKLEAMGPVNLVAIEEHQDLQERYSFLNRQHDDLVNARQKLLAMISKINKTTSEMFADTFATVNRNFDSMFKRLFNGGSAKLVLVDESDVLESGIEIIARPPGKKLQNVSLLSGGERTLTAVSLLFAIYMIKPSPFCVLDEIDAALDDSNIGRFIRILKDFLDHSQFLIITHSQQTIAAADVLYGVTMEEKGVSKIVSMKFVDGRPKADEATTPATV